MLLKHNNSPAASPLLFINKSNEANRKVPWDSVIWNSWEEKYIFIFTYGGKIIYNRLQEVSEINKRNENV
jgi:hypothetical protein